VAELQLGYYLPYNPELRVDLPPQRFVISE